MDNHFDSEGGEQNVGQGKGAIGKQVNATQQVGGDGNIFSGTGNVTVNGILPALFAEYAGKLAVTESALASFFKIMEEQQVPLHDLDSKLREIAAQHKELLASESTDQAAKQAIKAGDYAKAEALLEDVANQHSMAAAEAHADNARLQLIQYRHAKAAAYWQKAAALLPEDKKKERSLYLHNAGYDLHRIGKYSEALSLYKQSLALHQESGDTACRACEGTILNNIGNLYRECGKYDQSLSYLDQSLVIHREVGNRVMEGVALNSISLIYKAQDNDAAALRQLEQSLGIQQEFGDKAGESMTLHNIGALHNDKGDYDKALSLYEQSLAICQEIDDKEGEAVTSGNIGRVYEKQGELSKAEQYISRAVQLEEEIGHPDLEKDREALAALRAKLRGR